MADELGPRIPILLGSFLQVFGVMMISISTEYYQFFLAQSICNGLGCCFLFYQARPSRVRTGESSLTFASVIAAVPSFLDITHLHLASQSLGRALVALCCLFQHLIPKIGFRWTMRDVEFMFLGLHIIANLTIKSRLPPARRPFNFMELVSPFMEKPFLLLALATFFTYLREFLPFNFLIPQGKASGMSPNLASYLVPILNGVS